MPTHKIEVTEYECTWCHYRWINRVNGKDGPVPQRCAKCKRYGWNDGKYVDRNPNPITDEERGLRMRLYKLEPNENNLPGYKEISRPGYPTIVVHKTQYDPNELCKTFLGLKPRPTMQELKKALHPLGWNLQKYKHGVPNPEQPGYLKYDPEGYIKLLEEEKVKRREYMKQVIQSRQGQGQGQEASPVQA